MKANLRIGLLAALAMLLAAAALADVRPPVKVRLLDEPRALVPGQTYKGRLEVISGVATELSAFRFEGDGWRQRRLDSPGSVFIEKDGRLVIAFEVDPGAVTGPLEFAFDVDGYAVREYLDLSPEHVREMTTPGALVQVAADAGVSPAAPAMVRPRSPAIPKPQDMGIVDDEDEPGAVDKHIVNVHGRFVYQREDGVTVGADGVWVRVYDDDGSGTDDLLASGVTDAYGYYGLDIDTVDAQEVHPDLYVTFETTNSEVRVEDPTLGVAWSWRSGTHDDFWGTDLDMGSTQPSNELQHPALHILTDVTRNWRWLVQNEGYDLPQVICEWPEFGDGAWYSGGSIHICADRQWREDTHGHEYGHHFLSTYSTPVTPDYCNGICDDSLTDCGHCMWCQETDHDAFNEGWPNWFADVLTRSYAGDYGLAPVNFRDMETLFLCSGTLDDPLLTEGFLGAVLRDIEDSTNDDHAAFPGVADVLSWGTNEIFNVVELDQPTTPLEFLNALMDRYPSWKNQIWETAKNCGYEIDVLAPTPPANLTSSHATTGDSTDPTIEFSWTASVDDVSGIAGYGIAVAPFPTSPGTTQDIGDVTSYTTDTLEPGTYWFTLRPVDRAGRWSLGYSTYGPVTIREAEPADLTYQNLLFWDYPLVPRNDAGAGPVLVGVSPALDGNTTNTYLSIAGVNQGETGSLSFFNAIAYVDGDSRAAWGWSSVDAMDVYTAFNTGPVYVKGGRHTVEVRHDADEFVAEQDETNNRYGHQFVWSPLELARTTPITRTAPPDPVAGWNSIVDGQVKYFNCDGFVPTSPGRWNAITLRALSDSDDYDARLSDANTGAQDGVDTSLGLSARAAGCLDAVLFNRLVTGPGTFDVGVQNWGGTGNFVVEHVVSSHVGFGDSLDVAFDADEFLVLKEFLVAPNDTGYVSIVVDTPPSSGPLRIQWLDEYFATGPLNSYNLRDVTDPVTGRARLDFHVGDVGYNCLVMFRDPKDGGAPLTTTLEIQATPPDFLPFEAAGWHSPLVPRPADDGTPTSVALPDSLLGNAASTYFNVALRNDSPGSSGPMVSKVAVDGVQNWSLNYAQFQGNAKSRFNWGTAFTVPGGRHTMGLLIDPSQDIEEIHETNNTYGEQYLWSPLDLATDSQASRPMPPDRVGGWEEVASGEPLRYNCDGLRIPGPTHNWQAMAVMPEVGSDVDLRLHDQLVGTKIGFDTPLTYSGWGPESSDFCLVNYRESLPVGFDAGVLNISGAGGYTAHHAGSTSLGANPAGPTGTFTIPGGEILALYEIGLSSSVLAVRLVDEGGDVDWGLSLMPTGVDLVSKSDALAASWDGAAGEDEELLGVPISANGSYCLVVWKAKTADLAKTGSFHLVFGNGVSEVPDRALPRVTALRNVFPNPFNPQTTIAFDLAGPGRAEIAIFDLKGSLVRTLRNEALSAGRYEVAWNGTDDRGRRVASGVYMVRMRAGEHSELKKVMLVK